MRLIIAATDFSPTADNAIHYACKTAMAYDASVTIVHSYMMPVSFNDNPMPLMPLEECKRIADETMNTLMRSLSALYPLLTINSHIEYGDITDVLYEFSETVKPWMVVLGNSSNDGSFLPGGNLLLIFKKLPYTVMAVPPEARYKNVLKIGFACDFKNPGGHLPAAELLNLVNTTKASLHVINVDHNNKDFDAEAIANSGPFHEALIPVKPEYHYIDNENFSEGMQQFVDKNNIDWLIEIPHRHSVINSIFHKSHTKLMVRLAHIPIIALHDK